MALGPPQISPEFPLQGMVHWVEKADKVAPLDKVLPQ
jgi:hypothetical protein